MGVCTLVNPALRRRVRRQRPGAVWTQPRVRPSRSSAVVNRPPSHPARRDTPPSMCPLARAKPVLVFSRRPCQASSTPLLKAPGPHLSALRLLLGLLPLPPLGLLQLRSPPRLQRRLSLRVPCPMRLRAPALSLFRAQPLLPRSFPCRPPHQRLPSRSRPRPHRRSLPPRCPHPCPPPRRSRPPMRPQWPKRRVSSPRAPPARQSQIFHVRQTAPKAKGRRRASRRRPGTRLRTPRRHARSNPPRLPSATEPILRRASEMCALMAPQPMQARSTRPDRMRQAPPPRQVVQVKRGPWTLRRPPRPRRQVCPPPSPRASRACQRRQRMSAHNPPMAQGLLHRPPR